MRFSFDLRKSRRLRANPRRGIGSKRRVSCSHSLIGSISDPTFRSSFWPSAGSVSGCILSLLKSGRTKKARFCTSSLCGGRQRRRSDCMKKTRKSAQPVSADAIARLADQGEDVSHFFRGQGRMVQPIRRVNVDVTATMLEELDKAAQDLNVSRQAVAVAAGLIKHNVRYTVTSLATSLPPLESLASGKNNVGRLLADAIGALRRREQQLVRAMAACASSGVNLAFAAEVALLRSETALDALQGLYARSLITELDREAQRYRLHPLIRTAAAPDEAVRRSE